MYIYIDIRVCFICTRARAYSCRGALFESADHANGYELSVCSARVV